MKAYLAPEQALPADAEAATLVGRAWLPDADGPSPVAIRNGWVFDLSSAAPTVSALLNTADPLAIAHMAAGSARVAPVEDLLANSLADSRDTRAPVSYTHLTLPTIYSV